MEHDLDVVVGHSYPSDDKKIETLASQSYRCDVEVNFPPSLLFRHCNIGKKKSSFVAE
jgi:hypothetical protein